MKRSAKKVTFKRRGRPATGKAPTRTLRLTDEFISNVDAWAAAQEDEPGRSESIRRLVEMGLKAEKSAKPATKPGRRSRAAELATEAIERIIDPAALQDERDRRKSRLTKGPVEFRDDRVDLPKVKK
jgi:hypothetical protein